MLLHCINNLKALILCDYDCRAHIPDGICRLKTPEMELASSCKVAALGTAQYRLEHAPGSVGA